MKLVAVKLTETEVKAIEQLVTAGRYTTVSNLLRMAVFDLLEKHGLKLTARVEIKLERLKHPQRRGRKDRYDDITDEEVNEAR